MVALIFVVAALFTLGRPDTPRLSDEPVSFDGTRAITDLRTIANDYPQRVAGSDRDNRLAIWIVQQFKAAGLETHLEGFPATINGRKVTLQNVWAVSKGTTQGSILVIANRDILPLATQGANDNASGVAMLLELARSFTVTAHSHTMIFLCTSGDALGALGAQHFAQENRISNLLAVIALRKVATPHAAGLALDGWSSSARTAPPWLWLLSAPAARVAANMDALLPTVPAQIVRLAVPTSSGSQGPFVAEGVPAITVSAAGPRVPAATDTLDNASSETLTRVGNTVQTMLMAVDAMPAPGPGSGGTIFLTHQRTLPGAALAAILAALLLPLGGVTIDLLARCRRSRVKLRPAIVRAILHLAPWLVLLMIVYLANAVGQLPKSPGAVIPPEARVVANPRYLRVVVLLALLVLAYAYTVAVEHRIARRVPADPRATIFMAHAVLLAVALLALLIDPYSVLLVLPAAVLWPIGAAGRVGSIDPARVPRPYDDPDRAALLRREAGYRHEGVVVLLLLFENRTIPAGVVLVAVVVPLHGRHPRAHAARTGHGAGRARLAGRGSARSRASERR